MAGYKDTEALIIEALMGRTPGTEIDPEKHQLYALNLLEYVRTLELGMSSSLGGIATVDTVPIQPDGYKVCYFSAIPSSTTKTYLNFRDVAGNRISITADSTTALIALLVWNKQYWEVMTLPTSMTVKQDTNNFFYNFSIKKNYKLLSDAFADLDNPIGDDGEVVKVGEFVSVLADPIGAYRGFYTRTFAGWVKQVISFNSDGKSFYQKVSIITDGINGAWSETSGAVEGNTVFLLPPDFNYEQDYTIFDGALLANVTLNPILQTVTFAVAPLLGNKITIKYYSL